MAQPGVTCWAEGRSLVWHIGQSVVAYCDILGRVSHLVVTYWAECRSLVHLFILLILSACHPYCAPVTHYLGFIVLYWTPSSAEVMASSVFAVFPYKSGSFGESWWH